MIYFIIGTDTDAGKTYYGKQVALNSNYVIKPIETGFSTFNNIQNSDSYSYASIQNLPIEKVNYKFYSQAVSPHLAAEIDREEIMMNEVCHFIISQYKENKNANPEKSFYVELAGGLMVPLTRSLTQLDLIKEIAKVVPIKVDLVIGNKLGCINHAILTIDRIVSENIPFNQIIINSLGKEKNLMLKDNGVLLKQYIQQIDPTINAIDI